MKTTAKRNCTYSVGRRRTSVARVRLFKGKGESTVNGIPVYKYFGSKMAQILIEKPFKLNEALDREKFRAPLKKAGFLTRDSRIRERRKAGTGGKARRKKQSPKR